jgi:hypothetical protein
MGPGVLQTLNQRSGFAGEQSDRGNLPFAERLECDLLRLVSHRDRHFQLVEKARGRDCRTAAMWTDIYLEVCRSATVLMSRRASK